MEFATTLGNALLDALDDAVNAGAGAGKIQFAAAADTSFSTILAEITCQDPAFGAASAGSIALAGTPLSDPSANNSGTIGLYRFVDSTGAAKWRGTVSLSGDGGDMILSSLSVTAGQVFTLNYATISLPVF